ncbi:MAG: OmpH family outer membrane protein [Deltaproteobacteria bacterium]|nr:OmpH family outer membrane protein [Deltaproteobacteria bacterium]
MSKRILTALAIALVVGAVAPTIYADAKFAFVDLQRALNETEDGRRAKAELKQLFDERQTDLDQRAKEFKSKLEELDKQKEVLTPEAYQSKNAELQKALIELQNTYARYQRELAEKELELTKAIFEKMEQILRRIGQSDGYEMIFDKSEAGLVWAPDHLNLTDKLIQMYNSENPTKAGGESTTKSSGTATP